MFKNRYWLILVSSNSVTTDYFARTRHSASSKRQESHCNIILFLFPTNQLIFPALLQVLAVSLSVAGSFNTSARASWRQFANFPLTLMKKKSSRSTTSCRLIMASPIPNDAMEFPETYRLFPEPHLPPKDGSSHPALPFTTLTFAASNTHCYLWTSAQSHDTLSSISPRRNSSWRWHRRRGRPEPELPHCRCRWLGRDRLDGQPRPIVVDNTARWDFTEDSKLFKLCREGRGRTPWIVTLEEPSAEKQAILEKYGGKYIMTEITTTESG